MVLSFYSQLLISSIVSPFLSINYTYFILYIQLNPALTDLDFKLPIVLDFKVPIFFPDITNTCKWNFIIAVWEQLISAKYGIPILAGLLERDSTIFFIRFIFHQRASICGILPSPFQRRTVRWWENGENRYAGVGSTAARDEERSSKGRHAVTKTTRRVRHESLRRWTR